MGKGGLINNSTVTAQVLLSGGDGAPPGLAPSPWGRPSWDRDPAGGPRTPSTLRVLARREGPATETSVLTAPGSVAFTLSLMAIHFLLSDPVPSEASALAQQVFATGLQPGALVSTLSTCEFQTFYFAKRSRTSISPSVKWGYLSSKGTNSWEIMYRARN